MSVFAARVPRALIALLVLGLVAIWPAAAPAGAHSGGKSVVLVRSLELVPGADGGWLATAVLVDLDSGSPIEAVVKAVAGNPAQTYDLTEGATRGTYAGPMDALTPGPAQLTIKVRTRPGYEGVVPYEQTFNFQLVAGQPVQVASGGSGGGGSSLPLIFGVAAAVVVVALLYGLYSLRRRTAATPRPE